MIPKQFFEQLLKAGTSRVPLGDAAHSETVSESGEARVDGLVECPCCEGSGLEGRRVVVFEHGCGSHHDDIEEFPCGECNGTGEVLDECETAGEEWTR